MLTTSPRSLTEVMEIRLELLEDDGSGKFRVRGEFARADVPTNNGRIYSRQLLEREIMRLTSDIKARRLYGELDHPCFLSSDFRVLTEGGWKPFSEVRVGDKVWSRKDGVAVLSTVTDITDEPYKGKAYTVKGRSIDSAFTPAHRLLLADGEQESYVTLAELFDDISKYASHTTIPSPGIKLHEFADTKEDPELIGSLSIIQTQHDGNIYCLSVTHGNFYAEQNGKSFWTGNSDGRTKLTRASHIITNLEVRPDGIVIGEAEILDTPNGCTLKAILKAGGAVGVSSRGLGSTRRDGGQEMVNEDFTLKTWDFVVDPAAPTAYPGVFTESKEEGSMASQDMTIDSLREKYPDLISEIVQSARESAATAAKTETEEAVASTLRESLSKDMEDRFGALLVKKIGEVRGEIEEQVRSEMLSDPSVAASKQTLEVLREQLRPFLVPADVSALVEDERKKTVAVQGKLTEKEKEIVDLTRVTEDLMALTRQMGYNLYVERKLANLPYAESVRESIGDVGQFTSKKDMQKAVTEAIRREKLRWREVQTIREEADLQVERVHEQVKEDKSAVLSKVEQIEGYIKKIEGEKTRLEEGLEKSLHLAKTLGLQAYAERQIKGSPNAAKIRGLIESVEPGSPEEIDKLVSSVNESARSREMETMRRRRLSKARVITEEQVTQIASPEAAQRSNSIVPGLGLSAADFDRMTGLG